MKAKIEEKFRVTRKIIPLNNDTDANVIKLVVILKIQKNMYRKYDEIEKEYVDKKIPYSILLTSSEWKNFRDTIMREQGFFCQICQQEPNYLAWELKSQYPNSNIYARLIENGAEYLCTHIVMHLHHKYYIHNRLPWQYQKEVLQTLCAECHTEVHKNQVILKYRNDMLENPQPTLNCQKCFGTGYLAQYDYYQEGICFMCDGKGYIEKINTTIDR